ncbi:MAG TPA: gliding motility lipoprotein GldH [Bacteroidales bacterium]|nr:gliding motility lipoprotein GldH [Bacteroidales bacterium]
MTENRKHPLAGIIILMVFFTLTSCTGKNIYSGSEMIPDYSWNLANKVSFEADIEDTLSVCDINLTIRTDKNYPYRNIFLFVKTSSPRGESIKDTVEYFLADTKGNRYGSGLGDVSDLTVPFKTKVVFPVKGIYTFDIKHGMRDPNLEGVTDIGLQIIRKKQ